MSWQVAAGSEQSFIALETLFAAAGDRNDINLYRAQIAAADLPKNPMWCSLTKAR